MREFIGSYLFSVSRRVYREEGVSAKSLDGSRSTTVGQRGRGGSGTMNPTLVGTIVFACTLGGALIGLWLRTKMPAHHLTEESMDGPFDGVVKVSADPLRYAYAHLNQ
jgi:hypothetical protein